MTALVLAFLAAPPVRVVVLPVEPATTPEVAEVLWAARAAVEEQDDLLSVDIAGTLDAGGEEAVDADGARALLTTGQQLFADLELEEAGRKVQRAGSLLVAAGALEEAAASFALLAQIHAARKDAAGVRSAFTLLLRVAPDHELDLNALPPSVRRAFKQAKAENRKAKEVSLRVESSPVPAAVRVDGHFVGVTPLLVQDIRRGAHLVSLEADGYRRDVRVAVVRGGAVRRRLESARKAPLLVQAAQRLPEQVLGDSMGSALRDLRALFFADQAVLLEVEDGKVTGHLYDLKVGLRVRRVARRLGDPRSVGAEVVEALYRGLDPRAPGLTAPDVEDPETAGLPYHQRWWFWPAVGTAVVAAVAIPLLVFVEEGEGGLDREDGTGSLVLRF